MVAIGRVARGKQDGDGDGSYERESSLLRVLGTRRGFRDGFACRREVVAPKIKRGVSGCSIDQSPNPSGQAGKQAEKRRNQEDAGY